MIWEHLIAQRWEELIERVRGPMNFRVIMQPTIAALIALRAGFRDARSSHPFFLLTLLTNPAHRPHLLRRGWKDVGRLFMMALAMDVAYQLIVLHWIYLAELLLVATILALVPYLMVRDPTNYIATVAQTRQPETATDTDMSLSAQPLPALDQTEPTPRR